MENGFVEDMVGVKDTGGFEAGLSSPEGLNLWKGLVLPEAGGAEGGDGGAGMDTA